MSHSAPGHHLKTIITRTYGDYCTAPVLCFEPWAPYGRQLDFKCILVVAQILVDANPNMHSATRTSEKAQKWTMPGCQPANTALASFSAGEPLTDSHYCLQNTARQHRLHRQLSFIRHARHHRFSPHADQSFEAHCRQAKPHQRH